MMQLNLENIKLLIGVIFFILGIVVVLYGDMHIEIRGKLVKWLPFQMTYPASFQWVRLVQVTIVKLAVGAIFLFISILIFKHSDVNPEIINDTTGFVGFFSISLMFLINNKAMKIGLIKQNEKLFGPRKKQSYVIFNFFWPFFPWVMIFSSFALLFKILFYE